MRRSMWVCFLLVIVFSFPAVAQIKQPVKTENGLVAGVPATDPAITVFRGIPFAAPPVGDLRWRAPKPAADWQGVRKADKICASCMQNIVTERKPWTYEFMVHNEISEDCLYLNVWTPAKAGTEKLPVFVWIHGGGYVEGSGGIVTYDGEQLARKGLVVVTINYRVGVIGFLAHPELTKESGHNASGNYGLLDQVAALQWIQKNIAAFGGDPKNVTIAGQSAGARSVNSLSASPLAKGLFQRGIANSALDIVNRNPATRKLADAEKEGAKFAESKGARSIAELRKMSWQELAAEGTSGSPVFRFNAVVDGYLLPAFVYDTYAAGKQIDVPLIIGMTADEGSSAPTYGLIPAPEYQKQVREKYGSLADAFLKLYPSSSDQESGKSQIAAAREMGRIAIHEYLANRAKTAKTPAYSCYWNHTLPGPDAAKYLAFHTSEIPYFFDNLGKCIDRKFTDVDRKIADTLSSYWVNYAKTGDPNGKGLPPWPAFDAGKTVIMELGDRFEARPLADKSKIDFFLRYFAIP